MGGAPFNVAWNLHAFGDQPIFISRIGNDTSGSQILEAMQSCKMNTTAVQHDNQHPTGMVEVTIENNEPSYNIVENSAYDFIDEGKLPHSSAGGILYHGTLCLRNQTSINAYKKMSQNPNLNIFLDVNLRSPWWKRQDVLTLLTKARWVKMNQDEVNLLADSSDDLQMKMTNLQTTYNIEQLIVTRGAEGTIVRTNEGQFHSLSPGKIVQLVDTVGAGDAFSSVYIHGLRAGWPIEVILHHAQQFAGKVIGLRGATTTDPHFYQDFMTSVAL